MCLWQVLASSAQLFPYKCRSIYAENINTQISIEENCFQHLYENTRDHLSSAKARMRELERNLEGAVPGPRKGIVIIRGEDK
jgi:hypothetical protein